MICDLANRPHADIMVHIKESTVQMVHYENCDDCLSLLKGCSVQNVPRRSYLIFLTNLNFLSKCSTRDNTLEAVTLISTVGIYFFYRITCL